jgi:hypothetical protein
MSARIVAVTTAPFDVRKRAPEEWIPGNPLVVSECEEGAAGVLEAVYLRAGNRSIHRHDGTGREREQRVVQLDDAPPVRLLHRGRNRVFAGDARFQMPARECCSGRSLRQMADASSR